MSAGIASKKLINYRKRQQALLILDKVLFRLIRKLPQGITVRTFDTNMYTIGSTAANTGANSFLSGSIDFGAVYAAGTFQGVGGQDWMCLNCITLTNPSAAGGTDFWNRGSNKVFWLSIQVYLVIEPDSTVFANSPTASTKDDIGRIIIYHDKGSDNAATMPVMNDLLYDNRAVAGTMRSTTSFANKGNKDRFTILRDEMIGLSQHTVGGAWTNRDTTRSPLQMDLVVDCKGLESEYSTTTGQIGDITKGKIVIKFYNNDVVGTPTWRARGCARLQCVNAYN